MKNLLSLLTFFAFLSLATAQAPQGINFQGVARNADKTPKPAGTSVQIEFKIWDAPNLGNLFYYEKQTQTTNGVGLFNCIIGNGTVQPGGSVSFANIPWATGQKYLEVIVDNQSSARQLMVSVPYALYAEKAGNGGSNYVAGNGISINGNTISNSGDNDNNPSNEIQQITLNGNTLLLSQNGGSVQLPTVGGTTVLAGNGISVVQNGSNYTVTNTGDNDNNSGNEIQQITLNGNTLSLSQNGGSVQLPAAPAYVPEIYIFEERYAHGVLPIAANTNQPPIGNEFNTRNINTQVYPVTGGAGNVILGGSGNMTFKPGTYLIEASAPAFYVYRHQLFLRRADNTIELNGTCEYARQNDLSGSNATGADQSRSFIKGVLVVPPGPDRVLKIDHYLQAAISGASALGVESNQSGAIWTTTIKEVYATITIQKIQ